MNTTPRNPYSCILWDVDGTVADGSRGIFSRLGRMLEHYGMEVPEASELALWMGPPLFETFQRFAGMSAAQAEEAILYYRELAAADGYAGSVDLYPGIPELIREVHAAGIPQSTASTKPEPQVQAILEHFGLIDAFTAISGSRPGPEGRLDGKVFAVDQALARLAAAGADVSRPVLIGDRHHDVDGGAERGIPVVFADWGFGLPEEAAGAAHRAADAAELRALILP